MFIWDVSRQIWKVHDFIEEFSVEFVISDLRIQVQIMRLYNSHITCQSKLLWIDLSTTSSITPLHR